MTLHMKLDHIRETVTLLSNISPEAQLLQLKNLCDNNGIWTVPDNAEMYCPVLFEIQLFGITAIAENATDLPRNWLRAAGNVLESLQEGAAP